jgi:hypothetical protein
MLRERKAPKNVKIKDLFPELRLGASSLLSELVSILPPDSLGGNHEQRWAPFDVLSGAASWPTASHDHEYAMCVFQFDVELGDARNSPCVAEGATRAFRCCSCRISLR